MRKGAFSFSVKVYRPLRIEKTIEGLVKGGRFWRAVTSLYMNIAKTMVRAAKGAAPEFTGALKESISANIVKKGYASSIVFLAESPYAAPVEEGSAPHATISRRVRLWALAKGYTPWIVYRTIRLSGTKEHPFFYPAVDLGADKMLRRLASLFKAYMKA